MPTIGMKFFPYHVHLYLWYAYVHEKWTNFPCYWHAKQCDALKAIKINIVKLLDFFFISLLIISEIGNIIKIYTLDSD